ncbi:fibrinogen-like protein 1 [Neolamprologus brichardi]|uniref:fibrinogen-like protein 1 n=1 Tax=Neolamprologus brichardi TaxID=32507 RepID=UPI0016438D7F|nr:fibrinogen-like protein 1 [Neolamprologus brichardi]
MSCGDQGQYPWMPTLYRSVVAPVPCEERVSRLEAEIQGLMNVISEQHRYIQELHSSQAQQLQQIPNSYLGLDDLYRDCSEVFEDGNVASGLYVIRPDGAAMALSVYCDMNHGGGWTVFQRRRDGKESFDRAWVEYKHGFGDLFSPAGEFWLGNEPLHHLTSQGNYDLRINMEDFEGNERYAEYKSFKVDGEQVKLKLRSSSSIKVTAVLFPAAFLSLSVFLLRINTDKQQGAAEYSGVCNAGNLNGHYYDGPFKAMTDDGVVWYTWHGWAYSIKSVVMMIRASDLEAPPPPADVYLPGGPDVVPAAGRGAP